MLWVNMIQDTLGSLALATEPPGEALLHRKPYGRNKRLISSIIARNILGQGLYQSVVLLCLLFAGMFYLLHPLATNYLSWFWPVPGPSYFDVYEQRKIGEVKGEVPSQIYTLVFNTLVLMTSFNLINSRCIHNELNVFKGVFRNWCFPVLWLAMVILQVSSIIRNDTRNMEIISQFCLSFRS